MTNNDDDAYLEYARMGEMLSMCGPRKPWTHEDGLLIFWDGEERFQREARTAWIADSESDPDCDLTPAESRAVSDFLAHAATHWGPLCRRLWYVVKEKKRLRACMAEQAETALEECLP